MTLTSSGRRKERILVYGMEGTGKSLAALDIAARCAPARLHVIDNDNAWDAMLEGETLDGREVGVGAEWRWNERDGAYMFDDHWVTEGGNVIVYHAQGWVANTTALEEVRKDAARDDWCLIDTGTALWSDVSDYFVDQVFNESKADYFLQARISMQKSGDDGPMLDGWKDYGIINPLYNEAVMSFLINPPCHLLVTAEEEEVKTGQVKGKQIEDRDTRAMYGGRHVKPRGQKRMGHNMQTILNLTRGATGDFKVYTIKDRGGREQMTGEVVTGRGFGEWYLEEIAGWQETTEQDGSTTVGSATTPASPGPAPKGSSSVPKAKGTIKKMAAKA